MRDGGASAGGSGPGGLTFERLFSSMNLLAPVGGIWRQKTMTQNTQTVSTWQRVERLMDAMLTVEHSEPYPHEDGTMGGEYSDYVYDEDHKFRNLIADEIDRLTAERDEARAEVERLRLPAEAWEAQRAQRIAFDKFDGKPTTENRDELTAANKAMLSTYAAAAARAAKEGKP